MRSFADVTMSECKGGTDLISPHRGGLQSNGSTMSTPNKALHRIAARLQFCLTPQGLVRAARGELGPLGAFQGNFCYTSYRMPRKIRVLIKDLETAGFVNRGGKGDHRNFVHPKVTKPVTIAGKTGEDAKHYQEKAVKAALAEAQR